MVEKDKAKLRYSISLKKLVGVYFGLTLVIVGFIWIWKVFRTLAILLLGVSLLHLLPLLYVYYNVHNKERK